MRKNNKLLTAFFICFLVFNILFFTRTILIEWWYDATNAYSKCGDDTEEPIGDLNGRPLLGVTDSSGCDVSLTSKADDVIVGAFALSGFASAVTGAMLLSRKIERSWHKRSERNKPRPRRPPNLQ